MRISNLEGIGGKGEDSRWCREKCPMLDVFGGKDGKMIQSPVGESQENRKRTE